MSGEIQKDHILKKVDGVIYLKEGVKYNQYMSDYLPKETKIYEGKIKKEQSPIWGSNASVIGKK